MANKLKNLSVTSVDLVDQGANPDAHIRLFKRGEQTKEIDPDMGMFKKFVYWLTKGFTDATDVDTETNIEKDAQTFNENINREQLRYITNEMFDCCYALSDSFCSILCDDTLDTENKKNMMFQSFNEFSETIGEAIGEWAAGRKMPKPYESETGIEKSVMQHEALAKLLGKYNLDNEQTELQSGTTEREVINTMQIDKSKMTPEEQATLAEFEKKYGMPDSNEPSTNISSSEPDTLDSGVAKGTEPTTISSATQASHTTDNSNGNLHPEVAKALAEFQELTKRQNTEMEELRKSLEIEKLTTVAKKYEVLGKKAPELAEKLYDLKKAGGTVYDDYVTLLDENVSMLNKSGMFREIGSSRQGSVGTEQTIGIKAQELQKSATNGMTTPEAIIKAWEDNPELAAQYEAEYMGGK